VDLKFADSSDEEDEAEKAAKQEYLKQQEKEKGDKKGSNFIPHSKKRSMYDSDTNGGDGIISTSASSNHLPHGVPQFKKLL